MCVCVCNSCFLRMFLQLSLLPFLFFTLFPSNLSFDSFFLSFFLSFCYYFPSLVYFTSLTLPLLLSQSLSLPSFPPSLYYYPLLTFLLTCRISTQFPRSTYLSISIFYTFFCHPSNLSSLLFLHIYLYLKMTYLLLLIHYVIFHCFY